MKRINVIGAGLSGVEATYYLAKKGYTVHLYEMRPHQNGGAHHTALFGELVCSNSLKNEKLENACGLLKQEIAILGSLVMKAASQTRVPGGEALCVDRHAFAAYIDQAIRAFPNVIIHNEEVDTILPGINIIATGPLTSPRLTSVLRTLIGEDFLHFFDASSPIVLKESLDLSQTFFGSRNHADSSDYINCPLSRDEYEHFCQELIGAKKALIHDFDKTYFAGCQPIEVLASQGMETLRFGPLKANGLQQGTQQPYAVVQLRQDDFNGELYSMVGFQTNLTYGEQRRVFSLIPALKNAEFVRFGLMHRNTYLAAPKVLNQDLSLKAHPEVFIAGQLSGVEGYVESAMVGIMAGIMVDRKLQNKPAILPAAQTISGSLLRYLFFANPQNFTPMNAMFNLIPHYKKNQRLIIADRALKLMQDYQLELENA